jgi:kinetochor protein Mis14/NSL1
MESAISTHRRIELQSPEDLSYLIGNVRRAADESINAAFPPVEGAAGQEDELRTRIEALVNEVYLIQLLVDHRTRD